MKHDNDGQCLHCADVMSKYPGFYQPLRDWFVRFQSENPSFHVSCAGRGKLDQELFFQRGASRAHYGQSSHNYNAALDLFVLTNAGKAEWPPKTFHDILEPRLLSWIKWYGEHGALFYELPHIELIDWRDRARSGELKLVE